MFKVGIIGVRPRQFASLQGHDFKYIEISSYDPKKFTAETVSAFCRDLDRVVLLQTGAPKVAYSAAPKDRLLVLRNSTSISAVVRALNTIELEQQQLHEQVEEEPSTFEYKGADYVHSVPQETVVEAPTPEPVVVEKAKPKKSTKLTLIASEVPEGHRSQYALPEFDGDVVVNLPNSAGHQSYEILKAAQPGDIVRFARPERLPLDKWQMRITSMRSYYFANFGMLIEAHFFMDFVDVKVMKTEEVVELTDTLNLAEPVEEAKPEEIRPESQRQPPKTMVVVEGVADGLHTECGGMLSAAEADFEDEDAASPIETPSWILKEGAPPRVNAGGYFSGLDATIYPEGTAPADNFHRLKSPVVTDPVVLDPQTLSEAAEKTFIGPNDDRLALAEPEGIQDEPVVAEEAVSEPKQSSTVPERLFWRKVFFHSLEAGKAVEEAADDADKALERHRKSL